MPRAKPAKDDLLRPGTESLGFGIRKAMRWGAWPPPSPSRHAWIGKNHSHSIIFIHGNALNYQRKFFLRTLKHRMPDPSEIRALDLKRKFRRSAICSVSGTIERPSASATIIFAACQPCDQTELPHVGLDRRSEPQDGRKGNDLFSAVAHLHAFRRRRALHDRESGPPFGRGADRPRSETAATVRADVVKIPRIRRRTASTR